MNTTKTNKKAIERIEKNKARIEQTAERLKGVTADKNNIVNKYAVDTIKTLKKYGKNSAEFNKVSYTLCVILSQSKLKKLYNNENTSNEFQRKQRNNIAKATSDGVLRINKYIEQLDKLYYTTYNKDGERVVNCTDKKQAQAIEKAIANLQYNTDIDIIQDTYLKLWEIIDGIENIDKVKNTFLLEIYSTVIPSSQVFKGIERPADKWRYTSTNGVKELAKHISTFINNERTKQAELKTSYDEIEGCIDGRVYKSYIKNIAFCNDEITDGNGKIVGYTTNTNLRERVEKLPEICKFNKLESAIISKYCYENITLEQIADDFNISLEYVKKVKGIAFDKIVKSGIFAEYGEREKQINQPKAIKMFTIDGDFITEFESINMASKILKIDVGNIYKVLTGKLSHTKGRVFKFAK